MGLDEQAESIGSKAPRVDADCIELRVMDFEDSVKRRVGEMAKKYFMHTNRATGRDGFYLPREGLFLWLDSEDSLGGWRQYWHQGVKEGMPDLCLPEGVDLFIAGSTPEREKKIYDMKGSGAIVLRFSGFYPRNSDYTGRSAEQGGYAIDVRKISGYMPGITLLEDATDSTALIRLLFYRPFAEAIKLRDADAIEEAVKASKADAQVTPYLREAVKIHPRTQTF